MKKAILALTAAAALVLIFAGAAQADPTINFGIQFGDSSPVFAPRYLDQGYGGYGDHRYEDGGYGDQGYRHAGYAGSGYDDTQDCTYEWVTNWHPRHHHMVYGPHQVLVCN